MKREVREKLKQIKSRKINQLSLIDELKKPYADGIKDIDKCLKGEMSVENFIKLEEMRKKFKIV